MLAEESSEGGHEHDVAHRLRGLRGYTLSVAVELLAHVDDALLEIDVLPGEPEQLPEAQPGEDGGREQRAVAGVGGVEQRGDLLSLEDPHLTPAG